VNQAMPTTRIDRKKEETRRKIIQAALELFQEKGIDATTMEQIAERADVAKGTLYNYYPVKEAIIADFIQRASLEKNAERVRRLAELPDTAARMRVALRELVAGIRQQKELFERYFVYRVQHMISLERSANQVSGLSLLETEIIRMGQESGEIRRDLPQTLLLALFEFVFIEIAQHFYADPEGFDEERLVGECIDLFLHGARPSSD
jgi:AcrR family transcriptional regulator